MCVSCLLRGCEYLHSYGVIHGDIRVPNIIIRDVHDDSIPLYMLIDLENVVPIKSQMSNGEIATIDIDMAAIAKVLSRCVYDVNMNVSPSYHEFHTRLAAKSFRSVQQALMHTWLYSTNMLLSSIHQHIN